MFKVLNDSFKSLIREVIELVYFMRGSIQYEEMMHRTPGERELMSDFISERIKQEIRNPNPNY